MIDQPGLCPHTVLHHDVMPFIFVHPDFFLSVEFFSFVSKQREIVLFLTGNKENDATVLV